MATFTFETVLLLPISNIFEFHIWTFSVSHFAISGGFEFLICLYQAFHLSINHLKESLRNNANLTFRVIFIKYAEAHRRNYWQHSAIFCLATAKRLLLLVIFWNKIFWLMKIKFCFFFYIPFFQYHPNRFLISFYMYTHQVIK